MKLLMRPKPEKGESFIGYLVRLTELNGYDTPSWILSLAGIDYMELQWNFSFVFGKSKRLEKLAQITNNTPDDLNSLVYFPANSSQANINEHEYDFYGVSLNRSIIRPHQPKICPRCLAEFGYCLRIWDCALVTACPTHECLLLDRCPKCRRQIRAIRKTVSLCVCGYDWREIAPKSVAEREMLVSRQINRLCNRRLRDERCAPSKNPLDTLNLRDFIVAITFVARCCRNISWATGRSSKSIKLSNSHLHELYAHACSVFDDWPINFFQFLKERSRGRVRLQPHDGKLDTALKREFGSVYECLYQNLEGSQFDFLREAFTQFLTDRMHWQSAAVTGNSSASKSTDSAKYISLADARRSLKITNAALFDFVRAGEIRCAIINGRRGAEFAAVAIDIQRLKSEFAESMTCRDLAKELGTDCETIRELVRNRLIKAHTRRSTDAFHTLRFGQSTAERFLAKTV
jgi:TniQ